MPGVPAAATGLKKMQPVNPSQVRTPHAFFRNPRVIRRIPAAPTIPCGRAQQF
jgi:hypothetical protein